MNVFAIKQDLQDAANLLVFVGAAAGEAKGAELEVEDEAYDLNVQANAELEAANANDHDDGQWDALIEAFGEDFTYDGTAGDNEN